MNPGPRSYRTVDTCSIYIWNPLCPMRTHRIFQITPRWSYLLILCLPSSVAIIHVRRHALRRNDTARRLKLRSRESENIPANTYISWGSARCSSPYCGASVFVGTWATGIGKPWKALRPTATPEKLVGGYNASCRITKLSHGRQTGDR